MAQRGGRGFIPLRKSTRWLAGTSAQSLWKTKSFAMEASKLAFGANVSDDAINSPMRSCGWIGTCREGRLP